MIIANAIPEEIRQGIENEKKCVVVGSWDLMIRQRLFDKRHCNEVAAKHYADAIRQRYPRRDD